MKAIIFDFDGVVADSEVLANQALADLLCEMDCPTTLEDSLASFMGRRTADFLPLVAERLGRPLPEGFVETYRARTHDALRRGLRPVAGFTGFLDAFDHLPRCIASSSGHDRLQLCLATLGFGPLFGRHVYSAMDVTRGKPHPDIFLLAAERLGITPADCLVIEDSPSGVTAGRAAGMTVVGLLAGSHIRPGHAERLAAAGPHHIAESYDEVAVAVRGWLEH